MKARHWDHTAEPRFITFSTHHRLPILARTSFCQAIIEAIEQKREESDFRLTAYVIMPEHVHVVMIPAVHVCVGPLIGDIKRLSARKILRELRSACDPILKQLSVIRNGRVRQAVWQRRCYDHNCRTEAAMWEKVRYCSKNPVKRGLVSDPADWRYSSFRWYAGLDDVVLDMDLAEVP